MKPAIRQILVPTDFSESSEVALEYAMVLAERFGASLHLLHVLEEPAAGTWGSDVWVRELPRLREAAQQEAETRLNRALSTVERERFRASAQIADGHAARAIVEVGRQRRADLIVMGTHGRSGIAHLLLGSVTERVIRTAACPVLAVRTVQHEGERSEEQP